MLRRRFSTGAALCGTFLVSSTVLAQDALAPGAAATDPPTLVALGVHWPISGDDNRNATVAVRYRQTPDGTFRDALELHRIRPEVVNGHPVSEAFAGSIFDLLPGTTYEIELVADDPDGGGTTVTLTATTRDVPSDPAAPNVVSVTDAAGLEDALGSAQPGDVIELADGVYTGVFSIEASGTPDAPIVIRGQSQAATILDGDGAAGNILEVYGSHVHLERLTMRNANRALRFQGGGAEGNVVRRVRIEQISLGIGGREGQRDFYLCDNDLAGPLVWPHIYTDDGGEFANVDGIEVFGDGHVVCHNRFIGFGDSIKMGQPGRSVDFYGNEVLSAYDNAIELDYAERNVRVLRNRLTNSYAPMSFQPVYGGPAYAIRNVVVNVAHEQLKFHSLGGTEETSGMIVLHNTFVSSSHAMTLHDDTTSHDFVVRNNLFIGPTDTLDSKSVEYIAPIDGGVFDNNGWYPDGRFDFGPAGDWGSFDEMAQSGVFEGNGVLLATPILESGVVGPATFTTALEPVDVTPAPSSGALDAGVGLANINADFEGAGPDLGAQERGCPIPVYGPRAQGVDESNYDPTCSGEGGGGEGGGTPGAGGGPAGGGAQGGGAESSGGGSADDSDGDGADDGCGCAVVGARDGAGAWLFAFAAVGLFVGRRRRRTY